jgi:hypothetical protein
MAHVTRPIFLLSDFGLRDAYAGQVKAVIAGIAPEARIFDLSHDVEPFAVDEGAWLLETSIETLPGDAVVLAVVDPGVGTERLEIAVFAAGRVFVGPDNGLLSGAFPESCRPVGERAASAAVPPGVEVRELCSPLFRRSVVSNTFHGRDIFAPAAAHLAQGVDPGRLGPCVERVALLGPFRGVPAGFGELHGRVIHVDRFGNLVTTIRAAELFPEFEVLIGGHRVDTRVRTFAEAPAGVPFCHADSSGYLAVAVNAGDAARTLGVSRGEPVLVRRR